MQWKLGTPWEKRTASPLALWGEDEVFSAGLEVRRASRLAPPSLEETAPMLQFFRATLEAKPTSIQARDDLVSMLVHSTGLLLWEETPEGALGLGSVEEVGSEAVAELRVLEDIVGRDDSRLLTRKAAVFYNIAFYVERYTQRDWEVRRLYGLAADSLARVSDVNYMTSESYQTVMSALAEA